MTESRDPSQGTLEITGYWGLCVAAQKRPRACRSPCRRGPAAQRFQEEGSEARWLGLWVLGVWDVSVLLGFRSVLCEGPEA